MATSTLGSKNPLVEHQLFLKVAHLQSDGARKIFFEPRIFLRKMLRNFPRTFSAFVLWVRRNPRKIPSKFPTKFSKFPCEKSKKFTDELLQERRENISQTNNIALKSPKISCIKGYFGRCKGCFPAGLARKCIFDVFLGVTGALESF